MYIYTSTDHGNILPCKYRLRNLNMLRSFDRRLSVASHAVTIRLLIYPEIARPSALDANLRNPTFPPYSVTWKLELVDECMGIFASPDMQTARLGVACRRESKSMKAITRSDYLGKFAESN